MDVSSFVLGAALVVAALYANGKRRHEQRKAVSRDTERTVGAWRPIPHEDYAADLDEYPYRSIYQRSTSEVERGRR
jgi:hypothetical protein